MITTPVYQSRLEHVGNLQISKSEVHNNADAAEIFAPLLKDLDREHLIAMYIAHPNKVIGIETIAIGSSDTAATSMRETLRGAINMGALGIIVAHNHPHGTVKASKADITFTKELQKAAGTIGVQLIASLIIDPSGRFNDIMSPAPKIESPLIEELADLRNGNSPDYLMFGFRLLIRIVISLTLVHLLALCIKAFSLENFSIHNISTTALTLMLFAIFFMYKAIMRTMSVPLVSRWPRVKAVPPKQRSVVLKHGDDHKSVI